MAKDREAVELGREIEELLEEMRADEEASFNMKERAKVNADFGRPAGGTMNEKVRNIRSGKEGTIMERKAREDGQKMIRVKYPKVNTPIWGLAENFEEVDHNYERWVTRKQLEAALGVERLEPLHRRLLERNELKEGVHFSEFRVDTTRNPQGGNPNIIIYSYRGVIRVAMASKGSRCSRKRLRRLWGSMVRGSGPVRSADGQPGWRKNRDCLD